MAKKQSAQNKIFRCKFKKCSQIFTDKRKFTLHWKIQCQFRKRKSSFKTRAILTSKFNWEILPVRNCLGKGGFGQVWEGKIKQNLFAVKVSQTNLVQKLQNEVQVYRQINKSGQVEGFSKLHAFVNLKKGSAIILDRLGRSLSYHREMSDPTNIDLIEIMLMLFERLQTLHDLGFIHRDIKPDNLMFGCPPNEHILYLIDFGNCSRVIIDGEHIPEQKHTSVYGHNRYLSLNSHNFTTQSRRDDIQGVLYMFIDLYKGYLPWTLIDKNHPESLNIIKGIKSEFNQQNFNDLPLQVWDSLDYAKKMGFDQRPDYEFLKEKFMKLLQKHKIAGRNLQFIPSWKNKPYPQELQPFPKWKLLKDIVVRKKKTQL